ncbi:MAG: hybrid sensor histidine kinase/response regulator [Verrucomicrobiae bacterium]|jgi:response regulator RpfG family c-di-GMP phosphodiesterase|nr:hybrid sensor histidine kinase/response regulator [Verrucomicrobiae bacterium]
MDKRLTRTARPVRAVAAKPRGSGAATAPSRPSGKSSGDTRQADSGKAKILAVDDTAKDLRELRDALKATRAEVFTSQNGRSALEFLKSNMVDLIVLDVLMPEMDGYEVCRAIKHDRRTMDIPVIFVSGNVHTEDRERGLEVGAWDYISKPVDPDEVRIRIRNALEIKHARDKLKVSQIIPADQVKEQLQLQQRMVEFQQGMMTTHWHKRFGQLAANFLEELKHPLTSALGNIRMLMVDDRIESRHRDKLAMVYAHFRKVEEMLKRLLNISERVPHPQIVHVAEVVNDAVQLLNLELRYYDIKTVIQLDPTTQVVGMPSEIGRAVIYLIHNAIEAVTYRPRIYSEFTNDEDAEVADMTQPDVKNPEIRIIVEAEEGQVDIHVMDNGPGIDERNLEKIFDSNFTTKSAPHTGAGLHLARGIVRAAGGELVVFSPNREAMTQFTIALPQFDLAAYEEELAAEAAGPMESDDVDVSINETAAGEETPPTA